ncbi:hypothetical protein NIES4073_39560 [Kalymmatonema gypsitolerans NIES-4073]|nr:hypothetical protein NIES4073_39560 [Scytonema sp. NIES-4073]
MLTLKRQSEVSEAIHQTVNKAGQPVCKLEI